MKYGFIHVTKGRWEQVAILEHRLLESQEKLLASQKKLLEVHEDKEKKEKALIEAWGTLADMNGKIYVTQNYAQIAKEAMEKA